MGRSVAGVAGAPGAWDRPAPPASVEDTGLPLGLLVELAVKALYFGGVLSLADLARQMALPVSVAADVAEFLKKERLAEVKKGGDVKAAYLFALTDLGRERAREFLAVCGYVGPAPVTLALYLEVAGRQSVRNMTVTREAMARAFEGVILPKGMLDRLGPALNSGRSLFLYGPSGTGKTFLAERLARVLHGSVLIPHALAIDRQIIRIFDPVVHREVLPPASPELLAGGAEAALERHDRRLVVCERPVLVAGGELTLAMLDVSFDPVGRFYEAPLQLKANAGIFLIDDLGRQMVRPFDLLNRWIIPLEKGWDFLSLRNGKKFGIPFDQIILFSTNIEPRELADEAFLRRIGYKIKIEPLKEPEYVAICRQVCRRLGLELVPEAIKHLLQEEHGARRIPLNACHPWDIFSRVAEICRYEGLPPHMDQDLIRRACRDYFGNT